MTGQKFVMVMMVLFVGFGIGYVIFNGNKQNSSISAPQAASGTPQAPIAAINHPPGPSVDEPKPGELAAAPGPSAGQRIRDYQDRCKTQVTPAADRGISAQEMWRRNKGKITPYQMQLERALYEEAMNRCMEGALYDDPEAAQVLARSRAAVGDR